MGPACGLTRPHLPAPNADTHRFCALHAGPFSRQHSHLDSSRGPCCGEHPLGALQDPRTDKGDVGPGVHHGSAGLANSLHGALWLGQGRVHQPWRADGVGSSFPDGGLGTGTGQSQARTAGSSPPWSLPGLGNGRWHLADGLPIAAVAILPPVTGWQLASRRLHSPGGVEWPASRSRSCSVSPSSWCSSSICSVSHFGYQCGERHGGSEWNHHDSDDGNSF